MSDKSLKLLTQFNNERYFLSVRNTINESGIIVKWNGYEKIIRLYQRSSDSDSLLNVKLGNKIYSTKIIPEYILFFPHYGSTPAEYNCTSIFAVNNSKLYFLAKLDFSVMQVFFEKEQGLFVCWGSSMSLSTWSSSYKKKVLSSFDCKNWQSLLSTDFGVYKIHQFKLINKKLYIGCSATRTVNNGTQYFRVILTVENETMKEIFIERGGTQGKPTLASLKDLNDFDMDDDYMYLYEANGGVYKYTILKYELATGTYKGASYSNTLSEKEILENTLGMTSASYDSDLPGWTYSIYDLPSINPNLQYSFTFQNIASKSKNKLLINGIAWDMSEIGGETAKSIELPIICSML